MAVSMELEKPPVQEATTGNPGAADTRVKRAHVIVFGNEKGGTGKTTTAMHVAVALLRMGMTVSAIDLDSRQRTFARYIENRRDFASRSGHSLPLPEVQVVERGQPSPEGTADETAKLAEALAHAKASADFVVIDTPGNDTLLSRLGHAAADTLVTPMNDSFLDFDLLAKLDPDSLEIKSPSLYAEFVWDCRKRRLIASRANLDWVVMRNRVSSTEARNKRKVATAVERVSSRIGCRVAPGFSERVIFRELFPLGLTMLDLPLAGLAMPLTMSHIAARQEVRELVATLRLPGVEKASGAN
ncbi:MAG TPA: division plane positioning ATPase MipZ [Micropepsaceae bacterium]|nr:division plane positioning ATPase MipZ [Micropepsaceae bacterium]